MTIDEEVELCELLLLLDANVTEVVLALFTEVEDEDMHVPTEDSTSVLRLVGLLLLLFEAIAAAAAAAADVRV